MTASALVAGAAAACAVVALADAARALRGPRRPGRARRRRRPRAHPLAGAAVRLGMRTPVPGDLAARMGAAGVPRGIGVHDLMLAKCLAAAVTLSAAAALASPAPGRLGLALLVGAPAGGFLLPDAVLVRRGRVRGRRMRAELPDVADRMRLALEAGVPPWPALAAAAREGRGPLAAELRAACARAELGAPRAAVLGELRARCPLPEVEALTFAVEGAERRGTPLGPTLARLADAARAERARRARERAQGAAPKIQLVVALLLVPAAMLLIAAGMLAGLR